MAEFKTIPIDQIVVPERLRAVEEDHALAIAQSIVEHGLLNPITVRNTRAAKGGNYTLEAAGSAAQCCEPASACDQPILEGP
ncbi:ParB N-terminal domain-containing protein [Agrobacterium vitis]|uniref:ParB N-terminal domain-containing protein n=1 Tax=Agrobacterium vitis TaxID=373 RepID=UPI00398C6365